MNRFLRSHRVLPLATGILLVALVAVSLLNGSWGRLSTHALADSSTWTSVSGLPANTNLSRIACPNAGGLLCAAVGSTNIPGSSQATILTTTNGSTWTPVSGLPANVGLNGIACPNAGGILCVAVGGSGSQAAIFTTTNGTTWTNVSGLPVPSNTDTYLEGIACPNSGGLLCAAVGGTHYSEGIIPALILTTTNGSTWTSVLPAYTGTSLNGIACPKAGGLLCAAVGEWGILTTNNGSTWTPVSGLPTNIADLYGIACSNGGGLAVRSRGLHWLHLP